MMNFSLQPFRKIQRWKQQVWSIIGIRKRSAADKTTLGEKLLPLRCMTHPSSDIFFSLCCFHTRVTNRGIMPVCGAVRNLFAFVSMFLYLSELYSDGHAVIEFNDAPTDFFVNCCSGSSEPFCNGTDVSFTAVLQNCLDDDLFFPGQMFTIPQSRGSINAVHGDCGLLSENVFLTVTILAQAFQSLISMDLLCLPFCLSPFCNLRKIIFKLFNEISEKTLRQAILLPRKQQGRRESSAGPGSFFAIGSVLLMRLSLSRDCCHRATLNRLADRRFFGSRRLGCRCGVPVDHFKDFRAGIDTQPTTNAGIFVDFDIFHKNSSSLIDNPNKLWRSLLSGFSQSAVGGDNHNVPRDKLAAGLKRFFCSIFQSTAAGNLHTDYSNALNVIAADDFG